MGKDFKEEIEKACRHMNEILNKQNQTAQEVDAAHHYAEIIYYLTTAGAMNKAENSTLIGIQFVHSNDGSKDKEGNSNNS